MALPAPVLDNWTFQQIVDEAKRRIGRRTPEWTDHNVSDPGVTLIELFAWMTEMTLYRLNLVPERSYVKFLEMLGIGLEAPTPAKVDLLFLLATDQRDEWGTPGKPPPVPPLRAWKTFCSAVTGPTEEAINFVTEEDLTFSPPDLRAVLALPPAADGGRASVADAGVADASYLLRCSGYEQGRPKPYDGPEPVAVNEGADFPVFGAPEVKIVGLRGETQNALRSNATLWFGFASDVRGKVIALTFEGAPRAAEGQEAGGGEVPGNAAANNMVREYPLRVWEAYHPQMNRWEPLEVRKDETDGFFDSFGRVELTLPRWLNALPLRETSLYWVVCRYTTDEKEVPIPDSVRQNSSLLSSCEAMLKAGYQASPMVRRVRASILGGVASSSHCDLHEFERLGQSDGTPGQAFRLENTPVLARSPGQQGERSRETLFVGLEDASPDDEKGWKVWTEVPDFAGSGPDDLHFTLDSMTGELRFGPQVALPTGETRRFGAVPPHGHTLIFRAYRTGGGIGGNVGEGQISQLRQAYSGIASVTNPRRATGGRPAETLEHAKLRAARLLRQRDRAVTAEDFETLAKEASPAIGYARCVPLGAAGRDTPGEFEILRGRGDAETRTDSATLAIEAFDAENMARAAEEKARLARVQAGEALQAVQEARGLATDRLDSQLQENMQRTMFEAAARATAAADAADAATAAARAAHDSANAARKRVRDSEQGSGLVRVLLVPALPPGRVPSPRDLKLGDTLRAQVEEFLGERRLLGTRLKVSEPEYVFVRVEIQLVAAPERDPALVRQAALAALDDYFHPVAGGPTGQGWPHGYPLRETDVYACLRSVPGVAYFAEPPVVSCLLVRDVGTVPDSPSWTRLSGRNRLTLRASEVICGAEHRVEVKPLA